MKRVILTIMAGLASIGSAQAASPGRGVKPPEERTTRYWVTIERVTDGDTYCGDGVKYRELRIDTPKTHDDPRSGYKCDSELRLGELATQRAEMLLLGRRIWIQPSGKWGRYGRPLVRARLAPDQWYDQHMLNARLAAPYLGRKHKWCEGLR